MKTLINRIKSEVTGPWMISGRSTMMDGSVRMKLITEETPQKNLANV